MTAGVRNGGRADESNQFALTVMIDGADDLINRLVLYAVAIVATENSMIQRKTSDTNTTYAMRWFRLRRLDMGVARLR